MNPKPLWPLLSLTAAWLGFGWQAYAYATATQSAVRLVGGVWYVGLIVLLLTTGMAAYARTRRS